MNSILDRSIADIAEALRAREVSASELAAEAVRRHQSTGQVHRAYKHFDTQIVLDAGARADHLLEAGGAPPMCGIPVSVKDLYGVDGMPTFAGTAARLPSAWEREGWLVSGLRRQAATIVGKTHTVELAYGAVGINPHWETPRNPWDPEVQRIPGGSSCGAGVSLWEGSAVVALGSDTGGSIRIPASMTGVVGHKSTHARWGVDGVVPLSHTLDSVGGLTRSVADSIYFFGSMDPAWGDPRALLWQLAPLAQAGLRVAIPQCGLWDDCQADIVDVLDDGLHELAGSGWARFEVDGRLLDEAADLYLGGGIAGAECRAFLEEDLPDWIDRLHPTVGDRLAVAPTVDSDRYRESMARRADLMKAAPGLFAGADVLALPTAIATPPPIDELATLEAYGAANVAALRPTCPISLLGLCAITVPVGLDDSGMPVGLQLVAAAGRDEALLGAALAIENVLGTPRQRLGGPPPLPS